LMRGRRKIFEFRIAGFDIAVATPVDSVNPV